MRTVVSTQAVLGPDAIARSSWRVWGITASVAVAPAELLPPAANIVKDELAAMDAACNRFRPDSEISRLNRSGGWPVRVSGTLLEALEVADTAYRRSRGALDPTVGAAVVALGYDRDFDDVAAGPGGSSADTPAPTGEAVVRPAPGWPSVALDRARRTVTMPAGATLDLGATAKALCADRAASRIADELGGAAAVSLGGDVAVCGRMIDGGWQVAVVDDARTVPAVPHPSVPVVTLWCGGLATSGTTARSWERGGRRVHHIVDPATGLPAPALWRSVSVVAPSCVEANTYSTAAIVWGEYGPFEVAQAGLAARFVAADGEILAVGDWPADGAAAGL